MSNNSNSRINPSTASSLLRPRFNLQALDTVDHGSLPSLSIELDPFATEAPFPIPLDGIEQHLQKAEQVGPYRVTRKIAEGGMGAVYEAEQEFPIKRRVALKVIKANKRSEQFTSRFQAERQVLALMDHPNIARIFDAGETETGQPYFAMEFVDGVPLTEYCDNKRLNIPQRLELFVQICEGLQHAHQKGIIHRDLKPNNILVTEYGGKPVPKIIDFGLAKATEESEQLSQFGQILGTLIYMSPEQAGLNALDIDTRSDIYTLGVILFELLTGSTPIDSRDARTMTLLRLLEIVRDDAAPRPSSRLSSEYQELESITTRRQVDSKKLTSILSSELDWIVIKSLEKDRARRYASATEFAEDIQRYLDDEPIMARPPSNTYRVQKFVKKNRGLVTAVATILTLLIAGIMGTTYFMIESINSKARVSEQLVQTELAKKNESLAKDHSIREAEKAATTAIRSNELFSIVKWAFRGVSPDEGADASMLASEVLINAFEGMKESNLDDLGKMEMLSTLTQSFYGLGEFDLALSTAQEDLKITQSTYGIEDSETLRSMSNLAIIHGTLGQKDEAIQLNRETLEIRQRLMGPNHEETIVSRNNLATILYEWGEVQEASKLLEQNYTIISEVLGPEHENTLSTLNNLASIYESLGNTQQAIELYQTAINTSKNTTETDSTATLTFVNNLALIFLSEKRYAEALPMLEQVRTGRLAKLGPNHLHTIDSYNNLGGVLDNMGRKAEALELFEQAYSGYVEHLGATHPATLGNMQNLASAYAESGQLEESLELFEKAYQGNIERFGADDETTLHGLNSWGIVLADSDQFDEAIDIIDRHYVDWEPSKEKPWQAFVSQSIKGRALHSLRQYETALPILENAYSELDQAFESRPTESRLNQLTNTVGYLVDLAIATGNQIDETKWQAIAENLDEIKQSSSPSSADPSQ